MSEEVFAKMVRMISEKLSVDPNQITKETEFVKDLGADSLDLVELIADFELEFDLDAISDEEAQKIVTVGDAYDKLMGAING